MSNELATLARSFDKAIVSVLREPTVGMQLLPLNTEFRGLGKLSIETFGYKTSAGSKTAYSFERTGYDTVEIAGNVIKVPVIQQQVKINRRTFQAYVDNGVPISADLAFDMTRKNNQAVDALVIDGWKPDGTNYEIKGMYQTGGTAVTGSDFDTSGNAMATVTSAISSLVAAGIDSPAYNLVLNPTQFAQLDKNIISNVGPEMDIVLRKLNPGYPGQIVGRVFQRSDITAGTGFIAPAALDSNRAYFDLIETVAPVHHAWYQDGNAETGDVVVEQYTCVVPRFKHLSSGTDAAIGKISSI